MGKTGDAGRAKVHRSDRVPVSRSKIMKYLMSGTLPPNVKKRVEANPPRLQRPVVSHAPVPVIRSKRIVFAYAGDESLSVNEETLKQQGVQERLKALIGRVARVTTSGSEPSSFIGELKEIDLQRNVVMFWCAAQKSNIHVSVAGGDAFVLSKPEGFSNSEADVLRFYGKTFDPKLDVRVVDGKIDSNAAQIEVGAKYKVYLIEDRRSGHSARELNKGKPVIFAADEANAVGEFKCSHPRDKKIGTDKRALVFIKVDKP